MQGENFQVIVRALIYQFIQDTPNLTKQLDHIFVHSEQSQNILYLV